MIPRWREPNPAPDNTADHCHRCSCKWHGLECRVAGCHCPTAWTNPDTLEAS